MSNDLKRDEYHGDELPTFEVSLVGNGSRVRMNGQELNGLRDVMVHQPMGGPPVVTIEFLAAKVIGMDDKA